MDRDRRFFTIALALAAGSAGRVRAAPGGPDTSPPPGSGSKAETLNLVADRAAPGTHSTTALRYGGIPAGSVLRIKRGAPTRIRLTNRLAQPTSLEFHGMRIGAALNGLDGLAGTALAPSSVADVTLSPPDTGTFWFHPGPLPGVADQTAAGLAGVLIVEDDSAPEVDFDKALMFTDRGPAPADRTLIPSFADALFANGRPWPDTERYAPGSRVRLRIVNASTRRAVGISCEGARPYVIAVDGQPSELFEPVRDRVPVGPGARFDLMFDMPPDLGSAVKLVVQDFDAPAERGGAAPALVLGTQGTMRGPRPAIAPLRPNPLLPRMIPLERSARPAMIVRAHGTTPDETAAWSVNGAIDGANIARKPLFRVARDTPVTLAFQNASPVLAGFRLHGHVMRLLHRLDDGWEPYWRDSVLVPPGVTHHAAFVAENPGRWLIDSPFAGQAAAGLRTWFEVL